MPAEGAATNATPYQLHVEGFARGAFQVHSLTGREAMSEPWRFDVVVTAEGPSEIVEEAALGRRAILVLLVGEEERAFHGVVSAVRVAGVHTVANAIKYHVRVAPRLWLLKRRKRSRVFQNLRVPDVVSKVLAEAGIETRFSLVRAYPMREYITQYEETDLRFVTRLLAEAGLYFYFATGPAQGFEAMTAGALIGAAASAGGELLGAALGPTASAAASLVGSAVSVAGPLIPGDTVICADDAASYPPVRGDDAAALAASTAAALAPAVSDLAGAAGMAGSAIGAASAIAGTVIADATSAARDATPLRFASFDGARVSSLDVISRFTLTNRLKSSGAAFRDYDPEKPLVRLQSTGVSSQPFPPSPFEVAGQVVSTVETVAGAAASVAGAAGSLIPGASEALGTASDVIGQAAEIGQAAVDLVANAFGAKVPFEVYEHHSPFLFPKWAFANDEAGLILRQKRRRASIASGESTCSDLSPGHRFALTGHPAPHLDKAYVAASVTHRGRARPEAGSNEPVYSNTFECAPAEMTFVPPRPPRKSVQVSLTARVVGPAGQDIHVDALGRIKVQFHWDREGKFDENSSCWIRPLQAWGGAAWGHQFIPRVGMEVVVVFEGGDPDKPMILGSLYNGTHPPPFPLPQAKTWSGIRTRTTPGGHGFNELSFNDAAHHEMVHLHAQLDYEEIIRRNQSSRVDGSRGETVRGTSTVHIGKSEEVHVGEERITRIGKDDDSIVRGSARRLVDGQDTLEIRGDQSLTVHGVLTVDARTSHSVNVGDPEQPGSSDAFTHGTASIGASDRLILRADKGLVIECGDSTIEIGPKKITLRSQDIEIAPKGSLSASAGDGPSLSMSEDGTELLSKKVSIFTESGAMEMNKAVLLKGQEIKLGYDPKKPSSDKRDAERETKPFTCKLSNYFLEPYKNKTYHLTVEGLRFEGQTDGEGTVKEDIPKSAKQANIRIWIDEYPEGRQRLYTIDLAELPPATQVSGAKKRLQNLGYYHGAIDDHPNDELRRAIAEMQQDHHDSHGLEPTGDLDEGTAGALEEIHGS